MLHALLLAALPTSDLVPPFLNVTDVAFGSTTKVDLVLPSTHLGLIPGNSAVFRLSGGLGAAGLGAVLFASPNKLSPPSSTTAGLLQLDLATAFVIAPGVLGVDGVVDWPVTVPPTATLGTVLYTQAATLDASQGEVEMTNPLAHVVTDAAPSVFAQYPKTAHPLGATPAGGTLLITNSYQWDAEWANAGLPSPPPAVDFFRNVVVMHCAGRKPSTGFSVTIDAVAPLFPGVQVQTTLTEPDPTCAVGFGESSPVCFATVDRVAAGDPVQALETPVLSPPCP